METGSTEAECCLSSLLSQLEVPFISELSPEWNDHIKTYNSRVPRTPLAIALPSTTQHVRDVVTCAVKAGAKVQARCGGHSYGSFSGGGPNTLVVDLAKFAGIELEPGNIAKVGGGVRLGRLAVTLYELNKRALPHGTSPQVGVGGHFTHGGFGYSSRAWGLAVETIVAMDVVLANGDLVHVTEKSHASLFFALCGAPGSFGIIVTFYLRTEPAPDQVVNWSFEFPGVMQHLSSAVEAFESIQNLAQDATLVDRRLGLGVCLAGDRASCARFQVFGTYFGSLDAFNATIKAAILSRLPEPASATASAVDWLASLQLLADSPLREEVPLCKKATANFYATSVTSPEAFSRRALEAFFQYVIHDSSEYRTSWFSIINLHGGPDSQIGQRSSCLSVPRDALWVAQHFGHAQDGVEFPEDGIRFVQGLRSAMIKHMPRHGACLSYVDPQMPVDEALKMYYGDDTTIKLKRIKAEVDSGNTFWSPQSI